MIRLIKAPGGGCHELLSRFVLGARIECLTRAYSEVDGMVRLWISTNAGTVKAALCLFENTLTVVADNDADFDELTAFIRLLDYNTVAVSAKTADALGLRPQSVKTALEYLYKTEPGGDGACGEWDLSQIYSLVSSRIPNSFSSDAPAYLSWLSDFTFRKSRGLSSLCAVSSGSRLCACAFTAAMSESSAIISGVACQSDCTGRGYGKTAVLTLANELSAGGRRVYVVALNQSAEGFYQKIGFVPVEKIAYIERTHDV